MLGESFNRGSTREKEAKLYIRKRLDLYKKVYQEILSVFIVSLPWLWYFVFRDSCPNRIWSFLFFKPSFEYFFNVIHAKRTDCGTRNAEKEERHQGTADLFWVPANKTQSAF